MAGPAGGGSRGGNPDRRHADLVWPAVERLSGGGLQLLEADAGENVTLGGGRFSLSADSRALYQLNAFEGTINSFRVESGGDLRFLATAQTTRASKMAGRPGGAPQNRLEAL